MRFELLTIFPEFFAGPLEHGILRRAREAGLVEIAVHDLRQWTHDRHKTVDDRPFGGGEGMVLKPEPIFEAVESLLAEKGKHRGHRDTEGTQKNTAIVLLSAAGKLFRQETARRLADLQRVILICGRYEGVDERVADYLATDELSIGDFVLSGGELPAALVVDAATRLLPGALGNADSSLHESFSVAPDTAANSDTLAADKQGPGPRPGEPGFDSRVSNLGILDCPHYTRPEKFRNWAVPEVLLSGHHEEIRRWRRRAALAKTLRNRPDLLPGATLTAEDLRLLEELQAV